MTQAPPIVQIYDQLNGLFGQKAGQIFAMEYPGRILDMKTYAYKGSASIDAQQIKPQAVVEAEFTLCDDLFHLGQLTGGPNGSKLSEVYSRVLGNLIPGARENTVYETQVLPDQTLINKWLLEEVPNYIPAQNDPLADIPTELGKHLPKPTPPHDDGTPPSKLPRIDIFMKLLNLYEDSRFRWEKFKLNARPKKNDTEAWDVYNRTLSVFGPAVDAKLEGLWSVLLTRGLYHRVRHYLGLIDVESASESLLIAKEALRSSVMRSVDDSEDIYPVHFSPASWASYLTTDFQPLDLLMSPELLMTKLLDAESQRRFLIGRLGSLKSSQQDITALQKAADTARQTFTAAQDEMLNGFTSAAIDVIKIYLATETGGEGTALVKDKIDKFMTDRKQSALTDAQFKQIENGLAKVVAAQSKFLTASENVVNTQNAYAGAVATDPKMAMSTTQMEIDDLSATIDTIRTVLASKKKDANSPPPAGADPIASNDNIPPQPKKGASEWQSITIAYDCSKLDSSKSLATSASQQSFEAHGLFWSASGSTTNSQASAKEQMDAKTTSVSVGLNVMKVQINRPWFDPTIFTSSAEYVRLDSSIFAKGVDLSVVNSPTASPADKTNTLRAADAGCLLPAYSVAFLVAKDISISMDNKDKKAGSAHEFMQKASAVGGGCLCFSVSSSNSSSTSNQSAYSEASETNINIRIPGPQIIGWILECTPKDETTLDYKRLDPNQFKEDTKPDAKPADDAKPGPPA